MTQYIVGTIGDPRRGIDRLEHEVDRGEHFFLGYCGGTLRLLAGVVIDEQARTAEITLRATKDERDALHQTDWGDAGVDVGNSLLVARVFHVGLVALRRAGLEAIVNHPYDRRVRARYTAMGFERGERLDLRSRSALLAAFAFVDVVYNKHGLSLAVLPP